MHGGNHCTRTRTRSASRQGTRTASERLPQPLDAGTANASRGTNMSEFTKAQKHKEFTAAVEKHFSGGNARLRPG
jgi:hypothetical protein